MQLEDSMMQLTGNLTTLLTRVRQIAEASTATAEEPRDYRTSPFTDLRNLAEARAAFPHGAIVFTIQSGMCNTLLALVSAAVVAAATCRQFILDWSPNTLPAQIGAGFEELFEMPPREVGMQIGRLGPALEHSRGCHVEMSHKGRGPGFTAITSSPTQKYLAECPVITMRGNQYFLPLLMRQTNQLQYKQALQRIVSTGSLSCPVHHREALAKHMMEVTTQPLMQRVTDGSSSPSATASPPLPSSQRMNAFNEMTRLLLKPRAEIFYRAHEQIASLRRWPSARAGKGSPRFRESKGSGADDKDWRQSAAVIGVHIRGEMMCYKHPPQGDRHSLTGNASRCWQRFDWTRCVRNLERRALDLGFAGARVYLATDFLSLRAQAQNDWGDLLAPLPRETPERVRGGPDPAASQRFSLQELVTLAHTDGFAFASETARAAKSDSTFTQTAASWAAGRLFELPENLHSDRPFIGVFTVNDGCTNAWNQDAVEPFGHSPEGIITKYKRCSKPNGRIWKYTSSIKPTIGRERAVGAALAAALLQAHREQAAWASSHSTYNGINATLIRLAKYNGSSFADGDLQPGDFVRVSNGFFVATIDENSRSAQHPECKH